MFDKLGFISPFDEFISNPAGLELNVPPIVLIVGVTIPM